MLLKLGFSALLVAFAIGVAPPVLTNDWSVSFPLWLAVFFVAGYHRQILVDGKGHWLKVRLPTNSMESVRYVLWGIPLSKPSSLRVSSATLEKYRKNRSRALLRECVPHILARWVPR